MAVYETGSRAETAALGERLAKVLRSGSLVLFTGGLGAGKTAFCEGIARGLGCTDEVSSPTFALMNRYEGRIPVFHFDLYRLGSEEEVLDLGFDEIFFGGEGVCAVEWCEVAGSIFAGARAIDVTLQGEGDERTILLEGMHGTFDVGRLVQHGIRVRDEG